MLHGGVEVKVQADVVAEVQSEVEVEVEECDIEVVIGFFGKPLTR